MHKIDPRVVAIAAVGLAVVAGVTAMGVVRGTALVTNLAGIGWVVWTLAIDEQRGA